jgi:hypothetical protein
MQHDFVNGFFHVVHNYLTMYAIISQLEQPLKPFGSIAREKELPVWRCADQSSMHIIVDNLRVARKPHGGVRICYPCHNV